MTLQTAIVSVLLSSFIALVAYFYKEWKDKLEMYVQRLTEIIWVIKNNEQILTLILLREVDAGKTRARLELIPNFGYSCMPLLDSEIRRCIYGMNSVIIVIKESREMVEKELKANLLIYSSYRELVESFLRLFANILLDNVLWYYVFRWQAKKIFWQDFKKLNEPEEKPPKNE